MRTRRKSALLPIPRQFSSDMTTIVFNPEWTAPASVLVKSLLPRLRKGNYSILDKYAFSVSYQGNPVNPTKIDWSRVNIRDFTFTQKSGPKSNLGKVKFLLPNHHDVLLHDTFDARRKVFRQPCARSAMAAFAWKTHSSSPKCSC